MTPGVSGGPGTEQQLDPVLSQSDHLPPMLVLLALLLLAFAGMRRGWRGRAGRHDIPELVPVPAPASPHAAQLQADARYFGTTVAGRWLERVTARGLGPRSTARLSLTAQGLDVVRPAGGFRIPAEALRGARHDMGIAGKVVPPHGLLVVTWQHGDHLLDSGFRLVGEAVEDSGVTEAHNTWVSAVDALVRDHEEHPA